MCLGAVIAAPAHTFAVYGNHFAVRQFCYAPGPCDKGTVQFLGIQHADYPVESVVRRYPVRQVEEFLKPVNLGVAVVLYLIPAFSSADDCAKRYKQDGFKTVFLRPKDSGSVTEEKNAIGVLVFVISQQRI